MTRRIYKYFAEFAIKGFLSVTRPQRSERTLIAGLKNTNASAFVYAENRAFLAREARERVRTTLQTKRLDCAFTMIEVMAAMLILALVCVAYSGNQISAIQLVKATRFREMAIMLASQKMADIDFQVQTKGIEILKDTDQGDFDQEKFPTYRWTTAKIQIPPPDFSALMALGSGGEGAEGGEEQPQTSGSFEGPMKMITDAWGKSVMEVKLDVTWKEGEKEKSYSLMTHYIASNANQQIQGIVGAMTGGMGGNSDSSGGSSGSGSSSGSGGSSGSSGSGSSSGGSSGSGSSGSSGGFGSSGSRGN